ncbi:MAG: hypothetical protein KC561_09930, partial [Myxococcales bacterium]|nr:hypothetical protein [Myxococcales bacterium]
MRVRNPRSTTRVAVLALMTFAWYLACDSQGEPIDAGPATPASSGPVTETHESGPTGGHGDEEPRDEGPQPGSLSFRDFGPPTAAVLFTSGLKGYTEPCGCTAGNHLGGLERVVGFIEQVRGTLPDTVVVDSGDLFFESGSIEEGHTDQALAQARVVAQAMRISPTELTVPGPRDFAMGTQTYVELLELSGLTALSANLNLDGPSDLTSDHLIRALAGTSVGIIGVVDPQLFEQIQGVTASDAREAVLREVGVLDAAGATTTVLLFHGTYERALELFDGSEGVDQIVIGHDPPESDETRSVHGIPTIQAYDQGRFVGILKLYPNTDGTYRDARTDDRETVERIDRRLTYLRSQLELLPPSPQGEEPPIVLNMRQQIDELVAERLQARNSQLDIPDDGGVFLYWPVAVERGYREDSRVETLVTDFNASLRALNEGLTEVPPLGPGDVAFVGAETCAGCHRPAYEQ